MREQVIERIRAKKIITIVRGVYGEQVAHLAEALAAGGIELMEVTFDQSDTAAHAQTAAAIHAIKAHMGERMLVGAGTVTTPSLVEMAKEAGAPYVVAKAQSEKHRKILERIGADRVVFPEREMGVRLANSLMYGNFLEFMEVSDEFGILEVRPLKEWIGKTLVEADIRVKHNLNVAAIRVGGKVDVTPNADRVFTPEDTVVLMGGNKDIQRFLDK